MIDYAIYELDGLYTAIVCFNNNLLLFDETTGNITHSPLVEKRVFGTLIRISENVTQEFEPHELVFECTGFIQWRKSDV